MILCNYIVFLILFTVNLHEESQNSNKDLESKKKVALVLFEDVSIVWSKYYMKLIDQ